MAMPVKVMMASPPRRPSMPSTILNALMAPITANSRHVQNLRHLQKGVDAYDIKKRLLKRLDLEIKELEQKTNAIEHQS